MAALGQRSDFITPLRYQTLLCLGLMVVACNPAPTRSSEAKDALYLGVAYDVSGSVEQLQLPVMTVEHVKGIVSVVKKRGGAVAFGLIDEKAFEPLTRLELVPVTGKLDERARANQKNLKAQADFEDKVKKKIDRKRDARATDIKGSIARFSLFFSEPSIPGHAEKVFICISDGYDTGPWRKLSNIRLPEGVKVHVVGMEAGMARKLFSNQAILFESIDAAIENLRLKN